MNVVDINQKAGHALLAAGGKFEFIGRLNCVDGVPPGVGQANYLGA